MSVVSAFPGPVVATALTALSLIIVTEDLLIERIPTTELVVPETVIWLLSSNKLLTDSLIPDIAAPVVSKVSN